MKTRIKPLLPFLTLMLGLTTYNSFSQTGYFGEYFQHQCRDTNQFYNYTLINNPVLNGNPLANAIFTPYSAVGGVDENYHSGLYYNNVTSKWAIYNERISDSISLYSSFNILVPNANGIIIKHASTALNTAANNTFIDDPATNGKPDALLFISHNWGVTGGVYNNHATGVFYHQPTGKWRIFNEDNTAFPVGAIYNVFVVDAPNANAFVHTTGTPSVISPYLSFLDYPSLDNNSVILITHNLSPGGVSNYKFDTASVGVGRKSFDWLIANLDRTTPMDSGTTYNILIANDLPNGFEDLRSSQIVMDIYPNPSSSEINIKYETEEAGIVSLKLYTVTGSEISVIEKNYEAPGTHSVQLPADQLTNGMYFVSLSLNGSIIRMPVIVIK